MILVIIGHTGYNLWGWLEISGNFPLWYLHLLFIAVLIFYMIVRFSSRWFIYTIGVFLAGITLWFQQLLPERPMYHINVLPCALVYMIAGYISYLKKIYKKN